jgi:hypothetical protein
MLMIRHPSPYQIFTAIFPSMKDLDSTVTIAV